MSQLRCCCGVCLTERPEPRAFEKCGGDCFDCESYRFCNTEVSYGIPIITTAVRLLRTATSSTDSDYEYIKTADIKIELNVLRTSIGNWTFTAKYYAWNSGTSVFDLKKTEAKAQNFDNAICYMQMDSNVTDKRSFWGNRKVLLEIDYVDIKPSGIVFNTNCCARSSPSSFSTHYISGTLASNYRVQPASGFNEYFTGTGFEVRTYGGVENCTGSYGTSSDIKWNIGASDTVWQIVGTIHPSNVEIFFGTVSHSGNCLGTFTVPNQYTNACTGFVKRIARDGEVEITVVEL